MKVVYTLALTIGVTLAEAADAQVLSHRKISATEGGMAPAIDDGDWFGLDLEPIGDFNLDGTPDLAAGARNDDDGGTDRGAVYLLYMSPDGSVAQHDKISQTSGGFGGVLSNNDHFGQAIAYLGDLDGDGVGDLAVGAPLDDLSNNRGAVWVLLMNADGTVKSHQRITVGSGGFGGSIKVGELFGFRLENIGDLDGDGSPELAVGAIFDSRVGPNRGATWILFLEPAGTVHREVRIGPSSGGFSGVLNDQDRFGFSLAALGDVDGDGVRDVAVGAIDDDDGGMNQGCVWVLFMNSDGTVKAHQKISEIRGRFEKGWLDPFDRFGAGLDSPGDLDGNGVQDLMVGANGDDDGGLERGAYYLLYLRRDGKVRRQLKISGQHGCFSAQLDNYDTLGNAAAFVGDLNRDGYPDVAISALGDDDGAPCGSACPPSSLVGAIYVLFMGETGRCRAFPTRR